MNITCERCRAQYDIEDAKIPPTGCRMTCPACSNAITVTAEQVASRAIAAPPREIALSFVEDAPAAPELDLDLGPDEPAPPVAAAPAVSEAALADEIDFSDLSLQPSASPKPSAPPRPSAPAAAPFDLELTEEPDLPAPVAPRVARPAPPPLPTSKPAAGHESEIDLPAPKVRGAAPPRVVPDGGIDLPAPKAAPAGRPPLPPGAARPPVARTEAPGSVDLPTPKLPSKPAMSSESAIEIDLPTPKTAPEQGLQLAEVMENAPGGLPLDLDAPDVDDRVEAYGASEGQVDLPTPRVDDGIGGVALRADEAIGLDMSHAGGSDESMGLQSGGASSTAATAITIPKQGGSGAGPVAQAAAEDVEPSKRRRRLLMIGGGGAALLGAVVAAVLVLRGAGGPGGHELEVKLVGARHALADGTVQALRRAVTDLKPFSGGEHASEEAALVEAEAHFQLARLGVANELLSGKALLDRPSTAKTPLLDRPRAEALRALAAAETSEAKKILKELLGRTPGDAAALTYLGWAELAGRDLVAADAAFTHAIAVEPARAQAQYGAGLVKERSGDDKAARGAYDKVVAAVPEHIRAQLGVLRVAVRGGDATAPEKIEALMATHASTLAPRERAEIYVAMGETALESGRRDEADERFKQALALDGDAAASYVAFDARIGLARARVENGHGGDALEDLRKLVTLDLRGVDARLLLAEALIDRQEQTEAATLLGAVEGLRPKDARLALLRGRILLSRGTPSKEDREKAVELFRDATTTDPKLLPAWAALSKNLHELGRTPEALEALGKAADIVAGAPRGAAALGAAYLAIGRSADAEARFRAVLAAENGKPSPQEQLPVLLGLAEALESQDKLDDAAATYASARKLVPKSPVVLERSARLAARMNKLDDARALFDEALQLPAPTAVLRVAAADLSWRTGHEADARALLDGVLKDDERMAAANLLLARIELGSGHPEEAVGLARHAAILQDSPESHLVLGQVLEQTGKLENASAEFNLARRGATTEQAALGHARILVRMGATRDALADLAPLTKAGSVRAEALLLEGDCYTDLSQVDKARHSYEEAAKLAPQLGDAAFKLGRANLDAGKRKPGLDALERAVKLADPRTAWLAEAYLLLGDARRLGHEDVAAVQAYTKYLELARPTAPARQEVQKQVNLLGGGKPPPR